MATPFEKRLQNGPIVVADGGMGTLISGAVERLKRQPGVKVYLDAGNPAWIEDPEKIAGPLRRAGIAQADGFSLNVSNFQRTKDLIAYGHKVSPTLHFVIDTSRNGRGPWHGIQEWCNPPKRGLGARPTTNTGDPLVDAFLWVKAPGESDGECADGKDPPAGKWWSQYALGLARRAQPPL